jgi:hypothetical protein
MANRVTPAVLAMLLVGMSSGGFQTNALAQTRRGQTDSPETADAQQLSAQLFDGDETAAANAVSIAFAHAGVATSAPSAIVRDAVGPTLPMQVLPDETVSLARNIRENADHNGSSISLHDLGLLLVAEGWDVPDGMSPDSALASVLDEAVEQANQDPEAPQSFVPLFLQAIAERSSTGRTDFAFSNDPSSVQWSWLEVDLFLAANLRANVSYGDGSAGTPTAPAETPSPGSPDATGILVAAQAVTPSGLQCTAEDVDKLGWFKGPYLVGLDRASDKFLMDEIYEKLGLEGINKLGASKVMAMARLAAQLKTVKLTLTLDPVPPESGNDAHYSHDSTTDYVGVSTQVTVPEITKDERLRKLYECANSLGFVAPEDLQEQLKTWRVQYKFDRLGVHAAPLDHSPFIVEGVHADEFPDFGNFTAYLDPGGVHHFWLQMKRQADGAYPDGERHHAVMAVGATLQMSQPAEALWTLVKATIFPDKLPDAVPDLAVGFFKDTLYPTIYQPIDVIWETPNECTSPFPGNPNQAPPAGIDNPIDVGPVLGDHPSQGGGATPLPPAQSNTCEGLGTISYTAHSVGDGVHTPNDTSETQTWTLQQVTKAQQGGIHDVVSGRDWPATTYTVHATWTGSYSMKWFNPGTAPSHLGCTDGSGTGTGTNPNSIVNILFSFEPGSFHAYITPSSDGNVMQSTDVFTKCTATDTHGHAPGTTTYKWNTTAELPSTNGTEFLASSVDATPSAKPPYVLSGDLVMDESVVNNPRSPLYDPAGMRSEPSHWTWQFTLN